jgi:putative addiction module killer protein
MGYIPRISKHEVRKTHEFDKWLKKLKDRDAKRKILTRITRVENGNFGDTEPVGKNVSELRFFFGPGYRVYYTIKNGEVVFLLGGGTKKTQNNDAEAARNLAAGL